MDQEDARCNGAQNKRKVLLSCCSNVYRIAINVFTDNCWVYLMAGTGLSSDHPTQQPAVDNSSQQQWAATPVDRGVKVTADVRCEVSEVRSAGDIRGDSHTGELGPSEGEYFFFLVILTVFGKISVYSRFIRLGWNEVYRSSTVNVNTMF